MMFNSRQKPVFVWAHRGASAMAPENTMVAFRLAEAAGADGIELDIHLNRDGLPVVIHDETLDRTTDGSGPVSGISTASLLGLDAGSWFASDYIGEKVPLLADVLAWATDRVRLNIEIKSADAGLAVLEVLRDFPGSRVLVSSFNHKLLFRLRRTDAKLPVGFLIDSRSWRLAARRAVACAAESFHPPVRHVSRSMVAWCHAHNLAVYPWTVDAPEKKKALLRLGADGFFTNIP